MDFGFTRAQEDFRTEVRQFIEMHPPESFSFELEDEGWGFGAWSKEFYRKLAETGWSYMHWPVEYGGKAASLMDLFIMMDEFAYARMPMLAFAMPDTVARVIMDHGNEFQKKELLSRIRNGDISFWLGLSEPDSGTDLLSLKTEAIRDGDYYIINGQKTWSSRAHFTDYGYVLCRSDKQVAAHKGLSVILVDNKLPGITILPVINMQGIHHHNDVFFDNVRVHKDFLIGAENQGFQYMLEGLEFDRFWGRFPKAPFCKGVVDQLLAYAGEVGLPLHSSIKHRIAEIRYEIEANRLIFYRAGWMKQQCLQTSYEGTVGKVMADELGKKVFSLGLDIMSPYARPGEDAKWQQFREALSHWLIFSIGHTLAGGTTEVLKSTLATRGLGLPRS